VITVFLLPSQFTASTLILTRRTISALVGQLEGSGALASITDSSVGIRNPGEVYISLLQPVPGRLSSRARLGAPETRRALTHLVTYCIELRNGLIYRPACIHDNRGAVRDIDRLVTHPGTELSVKLRINCLNTVKGDAL